MTDTTTPPVEGNLDRSNDRQAIWKTINSFTQRRVMTLQGGYRNDSSAAKAELARLRSADPSSDERVIDAWATSFTDAPEELIGRGDKPSDAEYAIATALHLYAVHQQSQSDAMHKNGEGLGRAVRRLARVDDLESREKPVMRRFQSLTSATDRAEIVRHLRSLVQQFRSEGVPLDYAKLATDLYFLAQPNSRTSVRLAWARDVTRPIKQETTSPETSGDPAPKTPASN
ncbi:type I-E CRISPR-associated protein Cse2/CasB [Leucobacter insecticola]|uniref:Type I-E CRISPR-associated protein Cse2/CasB n=1 Tax=Leucobacter insecticola TaxID=2714934 RepID=A0A6G8FHC2_9MICO|nr:type I-E CRISPR-associated protein Cse2/CasB [Leucobacter insecticola]QIM15754.1 type I-E CRISPR-associated protein Cse2/CasB [Leucobacter insecticola]